MSSLHEITVDTLITNDKSSLITISKDKPVSEAAKLMKNYHVGSILVKNQFIEGIITRGDIINRVVGRALDPGITVVGEVFSSPIETIRLDETLETCMQLMTKKNIERILVVDENENLEDPVGILSTNDILKFAPQLLYIHREHLLIDQIEESSREDSFDIRGFCDDCNNYSNQLRIVNGYTLCPSCRIPVDNGDGSSDNII